MHLQQNLAFFRFVFLEKGMLANAKKIKEIINAAFPTRAAEVQSSGTDWPLSKIYTQLCNPD